MLKQQILEKHMVRRTRPQKKAFITWLKSRYPELTEEVGGKRESHNLILGDVGQASVLLTAHYDTPAKSYAPNLILPGRSFLRFLYTMAVLLPLILAMLAAFFLLRLLNFPMEVQLLGMLLVYYGLYFWLFFFGKPNPSNVNDNTSGVVTVLGIYDRLTAQQRQQVAVVLFDNEEYGCVGSKWFYGLHKEAMEKKLLVNFDCVSEGDHYLLTATPKVLEQCQEALGTAFAAPNGKTLTIGAMKQLKTSSDHKHFPHAIGCYALHRHKRLGFWVSRIHTPRDVVWQAENIQYFQDGVLSFLRGLG